VASKGSLATSILALVSGCSLTIKGPDPDRPRNEVPHCDTGKGSVGLDAVASAMFGLGSIAALADGEEGTGLALAAVGGLFVASAVRGNTAANDCRAAYGEYNVAYQQMLRQPPRPEPRPAERPRPTVARKPAVVEPPPAPAPPEPPVETVEPAPVPQVPRPETYGTPRPPPATKKPAPKPADTEDDWSAFWKEAP
jgi:hypothetical protein